MLSSSLKLVRATSILARRPVQHGQILASTALRSASASSPLWLSSSQRTFASTPLQLRQPVVGQTFARFNALPGIWQKELDLPAFIDDLRTLQAFYALSGKKGNMPAIQDLREAELALFPVVHTDKRKRKIKLEDLKGLIPEDLGRAWTAIREKVEEGDIRALTELTEEERSLSMLTRVSGIGPVHAKKLYEKGIDSWKALEREAKKPVDDSALNHAQQVGVLHFADTEKLIPSSEIDAIAKVLEDAYKALDPKLSGEILGSYRREVKWCSDVDLILRHEDYIKEDKEVSKALLKRIMDHFSEVAEFAPKALASGDTKVMTVFRLRGTETWRRIDIRVAPQEAYHYMTLGCTGDRTLMKYLRRKAADRGLFLNEYGMGQRLLAKDRGEGMQKGADTYHPDHMILVNSEEEIFKHLGLPYVPPNKRTYAQWRPILPTLAC